MSTTLKTFKELFSKDKQKLRCGNCGNCGNGKHELFSIDKLNILVHCLKCTNLSMISLRPAQLDIQWVPEQCGLLTTFHSDEEDDDDSN